MWSQVCEEGSLFDLYAKKQKKFDAETSLRLAKVCMYVCMYLFFYVFVNTRLQIGCEGLPKYVCMYMCILLNVCMYVSVCIVYERMYFFVCVHTLYVCFYFVCMYVFIFCMYVCMY